MELTDFSPYTPPHTTENRNDEMCEGKEIKYQNKDIVCDVCDAADAAAATFYDL